MKRLLSVLMLAGLLTAPATLTFAQYDTAEVEFWKSVGDSKDAAELEAYLKVYPNGKFSPLARIRLNKLKQAAKPPPKPDPSTKSNKKSSSASWFFFCSLSPALEMRPG